MGTVLVAYATKNGSTKEVTERIAAELVRLGVAAEAVAARSVKTLEGCDALVVGGALYTGRWHADARRLLRRFGSELAGRPLAAFALGPKTLEPADVQGSATQLRRALDKLGVAPAATAIFGGVIRPERLRFPFNRMPALDARDWEAIDRWAAEVADLVTTRAAAA